ncbi:uncharacterized protein [Eucyclogobius newberryi]|uniref:uncharacterized protein isoform X1 n=2 Tax=Eucyclogobius newberryi TaxID=166745 RepID=UPI003B58FE5B
MHVVCFNVCSLCELWNYIILFCFFLIGLHILGDKEEVQTICAGKEFRLPVYSTSRIVTFTPDQPWPRHVILEKTTVKDPRFEWTKDKMLVLKEVTHQDQGLYSIKLFSEFTYETVRLIVSECIKTYRKNYGENFEHSVPENSVFLEFSPKGAPLEAMPVVLWNRTSYNASGAGRGRIVRGGKVWVADKVTQADQGNYTVRDAQGKVLIRSTLVVHGHFFNVTRFTKESLNLPLFLPVPHAHLIFTPARYPDESSLGPFDPKPPRGPVQLVREGQITDQDMRYRGLISLGRNGSKDEVVIARLTSRHDGTYEVKDKGGNLVSTTWLQVIEKGGRWRAIFKSISVPSGMFVSLAGFILFMKRYPYCSLSQIITGLRTNHNPPVNPPRVNIQDYNHASPGHTGYYSYTQEPSTPRKWTPHATPVHSGYSQVGTAPQSSQSPTRNEENQRLTPERSPARNSAKQPAEEERRISFAMPGASDCLHISEECVQFQIKKNKERIPHLQDYFSTLPLDTDTSESCSVYTSDKLNFS